jgi:hypothetical protein
MKWWLIRHPDHSFSRPIPEISLIAKIEGGELAPKDEICVSAGYWFPIQDAVEVRKFFGDIKLERNVPNDAETSTTIQGIGNAQSKPLTLLGQDRVTGNEGGSLSRGGRFGTKEQGATPAYGASFEALEEESEVSLWSQIAFLFVILLIFSGTVYLLWTNSKK